MKRKVAAVTDALLSDEALVTELGLEEGLDDLQVHGWIVDTSIEFDRERFSGFLKVSLDEVLIALRNDAHFLNDPGKIFSTPPDVRPETPLPPDVLDGKTLYPEGFSGGAFVRVIAREAVWATAQSGESK